MTARDNFTRLGHMRDAAASRFAALVNLEHVDLETISLSSNPKFIDSIERSRARRRAEGGISSEEMRRRLGL